MDTGYHPTLPDASLRAEAHRPRPPRRLSRHRLRFMEGEDSAQVLVRFDNGVVGQLVTSWAYDPPPGTRAVLQLSENVARCDSDGGSLTLTLRGSGSQTFAFDAVDTYAVRNRPSLLTACAQAPARCIPRRRASTCCMPHPCAAYEGARTRTIAPVSRVSDTSAGWATATSRSAAGTDSAETLERPPRRSNLGRVACSAASLVQLDIARLDVPGQHPYRQDRSAGRVLRSDRRSPCRRPTPGMAARAEASLPPARQRPTGGADR